MSVAIVEPPRDTHPGERFDRLGRKVPKRMDFGTFARAIPDFLHQFRVEVPAEHLELHDTHAIVACVCGGSPRVEDLAVAECGCGRFFTKLGEHVQVARP